MKIIKEVKGDDTIYKLMDGDVFISQDINKIPIPEISHNGGKEFMMLIRCILDKLKEKGIDITE